MHVVFGAQGIEPVERVEVVGHVAVGGSITVVLPLRMWSPLNSRPSRAGSGTGGWLRGRACAPPAGYG